MSHPLPRTAKRTASAADIFRRLEMNHGIARDLASDRLHAIKQASGRGGDDNVIFGVTGDVYDPVTLEWLGSLTAGGGKRR